MSNADKVNILVVDDLPEKILVLETVLEELGENVITARSGEQALGRVLEHEFAVVLLDVNMPGMDGYETAQLIRRRKKSAHTPIIIITAFALVDSQAAPGPAECVWRDPDDRLHENTATTLAEVSELLARAVERAVTAGRPEELGGSTPRRREENAGGRNGEPRPWWSEAL